MACLIQPKYRQVTAQQFSEGYWVRLASGDIERRSHVIIAQNEDCIVVLDPQWIIEQEAVEA